MKSSTEPEVVDDALSTDHGSVGSTIKTSHFNSTTYLTIDHTLSTHKTKNAVFSLTENFLQPEECSRLFTRLKRDTKWQSQSIHLKHRIIKVPRMVALFGKQAYTYNDSTLKPEGDIPPVLAELLERVNAFYGVQFNSVLATLYKNENNSVAWHADDEPELGLDPSIATLSLGETRALQFKNVNDPSWKFTFAVKSGSLSLMSGPVQRFWKHRIPKENSQKHARISLTFRKIATSAATTGTRKSAVPGVECRSTPE